MVDSIYILILVVMGLGVAFTTARSANQRETIHSGPIAKLFNYLASGLIAMLAPTVLCSIFFIHPNFLGQVVIAGVNITVFVHAVLIALTMITLALILLVPFAILEKPHRDRLKQAEDRGWTRKDAETSGL
ncbi:MAG: hypothetical protein ACFE0Q_09785 [Anaerolineae bacterium]